MADDGSTQTEDAWPLPKFYFEVKWDSTVVSFREVSGLDIESQPLEYRSGDSPVFSTIKVPGSVKYGNVTMKRGVLSRGNQFWDWFNEIKMNTIKRRPITISLLDESGAPTMVWTLANAFPVKVTTADMSADGNDVAVESIEVAHEGIAIANG